MDRREMWVRFACAAVAQIETLDCSDWAGRMADRMLEDYDKRFPESGTELCDCCGMLKRGASMRPDPADICQGGTSHDRILCDECESKLRNEIA